MIRYNIFFRRPLFLCGCTNSLTWSKLTYNVSRIHLASSNQLFYEPDKKGGYVTKKTVKKNLVQSLRDGLQELTKEIQVFRHEMYEQLLSDPLLIYRPGETDVVWKFSEAGTIDNWIHTSDSDHNEGKSVGSLILNQNGNALFSGILNKEVPKDGKTKRAGYCNLRTKRIRKSFKRDSYLDWTMYNTLVMKVRGDGRSYLLNISCEGYFDAWWYDTFHFALYTRGGPYWQMVRIPFSKFFLSSKGRTQDKQTPLPLNRVSHFGITASDSIDGPFQLEIDYIGVETDPLNTEEFAYEQYKTKEDNIAQS